MKAKPGGSGRPPAYAAAEPEERQGCRLRLYRQPGRRSRTAAGGIKDNIDLSSRRADNVVAYFQVQGVNPNILSAKGFGDTHPVASNDAPDGRAKNRRIEIVMEGPGA